MMVYKRGDIVTINFNQKKGHKVRKIRPALIISADEENEILDTIIVMPLSTKLIDDIKPYRVRITNRENLKNDSDILINHIRTISKDKAGQIIAKIGESEYQEVIKALCNNFY